MWLLVLRISSMLCVCCVFQELYERYEATEGLSRRTMKARLLWDAILESQVRRRRRRQTPWLMVCGWIRDVTPGHLLKRTTTCRRTELC